MLNFQRLVIVRSWNTTVLFENTKRASLGAYIKKRLQIAGTIANRCFDYKKNPTIARMRLDYYHNENSQHLDGIVLNTSNTLWFDED